MNAPTLILMPGLDGTGDLFGPLLDIIPTSWDRLVLSYPADQLCSYEALLRLIDKKIPADKMVVLVAESFSGPLALRYAASHPGRVKAVVLCASFIQSPVPRWVGWLAHPLLFRGPMSLLALRMLLLDGASKDFIRKARKTIRRVRPAVLADRIRQIVELDCTHALAQCPTPILYLRASRDRLVRSRSLRVILIVRPDVTVVSINAPHLLLQTHPQAAWRKIEQYLSSRR